MKYLILLTLGDIEKYIKENLSQINFGRKEKLFLRDTENDFELGFTFDLAEMKKIVNSFLQSKNYHVIEISLSEDENYYFQCEVENFNEFKIKETENRDSILNGNFVEFYRDTYSPGVLDYRLLKCLNAHFNEEKVIEILNTEKKELLKIRRFGEKSYIELINYFQENGIDTDQYPISENYKKK